MTPGGVAAAKRGDANAIRAGVLVGDGAAIVGALTALGAQRERIAGIVSPDLSGVVQGVAVLGGALNAQALAAAAAPIDAAVLCGAPGERRSVRKFLSDAAGLGLRPMIAELSDGTSIRALTLADVLGRPRSGLDLERMREAIAGRRVLVTGAGGSIGSELCRQIAALRPARLILLDSSEYNLFSIDHELARVAPDVSRSAALCCIRSQDAVTRWFARERPEIVFHAAALKQVPLLESHASEGVLTNVQGTRHVARAARAAGADMVFVSTDKAVNPRNTMGATKRMAELYCQALDVQAGGRDGPRFLVARLGNVLGSAGSVSPLFERQIAAGGPVTVTHRDVARYFITIPQASEFLMQAAASSLTGADARRGAAQVLDMGEALPVVDLARDMIRLAGFKPEQEIEIQFVGLRPGEKLFERLIGDDEWVEGDADLGVMTIAAAPRALEEIDAEIDQLIALAAAGRDEMVRTRLHAFVAPRQAEPAQAAVAS
ncbi:MAG: polysaccharide biosynthesis protein [Hyphomonadaceae bacterium]